MLNRETWVASLRSKIGTPFGHQGRASGERGAIDCIGLLAVVGAELKLTNGAIGIKDYTNVPDSQMFNVWCERYLVSLPWSPHFPLRDQLQVGDIMTFWIEHPEYPRHVAVYTGRDSQGRDMMIHSYAKVSRGVVEMPINPAYWSKRIHGLWTLPEFSET